jgi:hypothetical protein
MDASPWQCTGVRVVVDPRVSRQKRSHVVPQPPYSPDLDPADFFLFPKLKSTLKGQGFESIEDTEENSLTELRSIPKKKKSFQDCFQNWKNLWERCIKTGGEYFEGDKADCLLDKWNKVLSKKFGNFLNRPRMVAGLRVGI